MRHFSNITKAFFAALFVLAVFVSTKINFSTLVGAENQFFTIFQFFGPIAGGILGAGVGVMIVGSAQLLNTAISYINGNEVQLLTLLRILPMLFAAYYFGTKRKYATIVVPIVAIAAFIIHPIGREVWYFTLFWTIPVIAAFFKHRLFMRSLGATFTAHSVGGAIWIWTVPMTAEAWMLLIPVVIVERLLFAAGISASYIAANTLLARVESNVPLISVDKRYVLSRKFFRFS